MIHLSPTRIAGRTRWLSQLTAALDEAQYLLSQLSMHGDDPAEADRLRTLVLALGCEIELLRSDGFVERREVSPPAPLPKWRGRPSND